MSVGDTVTQLLRSHAPANSAAMLVEIARYQLRCAEMLNYVQGANTQRRYLDFALAIYARLTPEEIETCAEELLRDMETARQLENDCAANLARLKREYES